MKNDEQNPTPSSDEANAAGQSPEPAAATPANLTPTAPPEAGEDAEAQEQMIQRKAILEDLNAGYMELTTASTDEEVAALVKAAGFEDDELKDGVELLKTASTSVGVRYEDLGKKRRTQGEFAEAREKARKEYVTFRRKARIVFPSADANEALALRGTLPEDFNVLVTLASQSYSAASKAPYTAKLSKRSYNVDRLKALTAEIDSLVEKGSERNSAKGGAIKATSDRNKAYAAFREFIVEFRGLVRIEMEGHPGAKTKMGW